MAQLHTLPANVVLASAGTAQRIQTEDNLVLSVIIQARDTNTGDIYIGDSNVNASSKIGTKLAAGKTFALNPSSVEGGLEEINLKGIFFDGGTTNDEISVSYMEKD